MSQNMPSARAGHTKTSSYVPNSLRYKNMEYRRCGKSGILLPPLSLGLWKNFGSESDFDTCLQILHTAFDHGITHLDLANNYGPPYGSAELTLGKAMETSLRPYRDELFISTKAGYDMWPGPYGNWGSRKYLMASLDQSLQRMKLDYVDLFYIHRYDPLTPLDETLQALADIVKAGKALYVGISRWPLTATRYGIDYLSARDVRCLTYQGRINLIDQKPKEEGFLTMCKERGIGFVSFSPLAQGLLSDKYLNGNIPPHSRMALGQTLKEESLTPPTLQRLQQLNTWAKAHDMSLSALALRWVLSQTGLTSAIVGVSSAEQLIQNITAATLPPLTEGELNEIDQITQQTPLHTS